MERTLPTQIKYPLSATRSNGARFKIFQDPTTGERTIEIEGGTRALLIACCGGEGAEAVKQWAGCEIPKIMYMLLNDPQRRMQISAIVQMVGNDFRIAEVQDVDMDRQGDIYSCDHCNMFHGSYARVAQHEKTCKHRLEGLPPWGSPEGMAPSEELLTVPSNVPFQFPMLASDAEAAAAAAVAAPASPPQDDPASSAPEWTISEDEQLVRTWARAVPPRGGGHLYGAARLLEGTWDDHSEPLVRAIRQALPTRGATKSRKRFHELKTRLAAALHEAEKQHWEGLEQPAV